MTKTLTSQFLLGILVLFGAIVPLVLLSVLGLGVGAMVVKVGRRARRHARGA
jgi:lauroyl/myristoyl acyltransferase